MRLRLPIANFISNKFKQPQATFMISANATELLASWIVSGGVCGDGCKSLQKGYPFVISN
jgi:hypothetical protein